MDNEDQLKGLLWNVEADELRKLEDPEFIEIPQREESSLVLFRFKKNSSHQRDKRPAA